MLQLSVAKLHSKSILYIFNFTVNISHFAEKY